MRTRSIFPRSGLTLALGAALLGITPAAAAQALTTRTGAPVAYRIGLPAGAEVVGGGPFMAAETKHVAVVVMAVDLVEQEGGASDLSDADQRRLMTHMIMASDTLLLALIRDHAQEQGMELENVEIEVRTLGGQRAGYLRGLVAEDGERGTMELYLTVKDGIMYMLAFAIEDTASPSSASLIASIHASFVLADAPPPAGARVRPAAGMRRRSR